MVAMSVTRCRVITLLLTVGLFALANAASEEEFGSRESMCDVKTIMRKALTTLCRLGTMARSVTRTTSILAASVFVPTANATAEPPKAKASLDTEETIIGMGSTPDESAPKYGDAAANASQMGVAMDGKETHGNSTNVLAGMDMSHLTLFNDVMTGKYGVDLTNEQKMHRMAVVAAYTDYDEHDLEQALEDMSLDELKNLRSDLRKAAKDLDMDLGGFGSGVPFDFLAAAYEDFEKLVEKFVEKRLADEQAAAEEAARIAEEKRLADEKAAAEEAARMRANAAKEDDQRAQDIDMAAYHAKFRCLDEPNANGCMAQIDDCVEAVKQRAREERESGEDI